MNDPLSINLNSSSGVVAPSTSKMSNNNTRPKARRLPSLRDLISKTSKPSLSSSAYIGKQQQVSGGDDSSLHTASTMACSSTASVRNSDSTIEVYEEPQAAATASEALDGAEPCTSPSADTAASSETKEATLQQATSASSTKHVHFAAAASSSVPKEAQESSANAKEDDNKEDVRVDIVCTLPCLQQLSAQERWETWWCPHEYQAIRLAAKYSTKQVRKSDPAAGESVAKCFQQAVHGIQSNADQEAALQDPLVAQAVTLPKTMGDRNKQPMASMVPWSTSKFSARGLEKYVSQAHKQERFQRVKDSRSVVAELSKNKNKKTTSPSVSAQEIAETYQAHTRYAVLFARCMGVADAHAAQLVLRNESESTDKTKKEENKNEKSSRKAPLRSFSSDMSVGSIDTVSSADDSIVHNVAQQQRRTGSRRASMSSLIRHDEAVPASTHQGASHNNGNGNNGNNNGLTSLQRSFSKRSLFRRHSSQQTLAHAQQQEQQQQPMEGATISFPPRSESRRALLQRQASSQRVPGTVRRQESLKRLGSIRRLSTGNGNNNGDNNGGLSRQGSARVLLHQQRQEQQRSSRRLSSGPSSPTAATSSSSMSSTSSPPPPSSTRARASRQRSFRRLSLERSNSQPRILPLQQTRSESPLDETCAGASRRRRHRSTGSSTTPLSPRQKQQQPQEPQA